MNTFTADASAALGGPPWLARRRAEALERFRALSLPTEAEEVWRYSGIDGFDLDRFVPVAPVPGGPRADALARARALAEPMGPRAALVVTVGGVVVHVDDPGLADAGVVIEAARGDEPLPGLGALEPVHDAFGELHDAFLVDALSVRFAPKASPGLPVVVVHLVDGRAAPGPTPAGAPASFPRTSVSVGTSADAGVVELLASAGDEGAALVVPVAELDVGDDARLSYVNVQQLGPQTVHLGTQASRVGRDATLRSFTAGFGAAYARVRTDSDLVGQGGETMLHAAYLGTGEQVHDFRTLQDHHAPRTRSELIFEGAVADAARSVYSGMIRIRKGARGADAFQTNHNLVLSEGAHADSVPNLDIQENDVRCSHASTVGPIDEEQRYYLESRGIEPTVAERLIVLGFFSAMAARAPFDGPGRVVEETVARRLAGRIGPPAPGEGRHG